LVRSGNRVLLPTEAGVSQILLDAVAQRSLKLRGKRPVEVLHSASLAKYQDKVMARPDKFRVNAMFINSGARQYTDKLKITPTYLSEIPKLLDKKLKPNVVLLKVSPPDKRGYVSTGPSAGLIADLVADPKVRVIAEVSPSVPRTRGASRMHISHIDRIVETKEPVSELKWGKSSLVDLAIGRNGAKQIKNGSTLQLGIGPLQKTVSEQLAKRGKKINQKGGQFKVRIRSEMIDDGLVAMANAGIISKSRSAIQLGFAVGTKRLYDFLGKDKRVKMMTTRKINDPYEAGKRNKLTAVNSAVAIDLYGQACSEMVPRTGSDGKVVPVPYSGVGGQVDFFRAAARSKGGMGVLTMRSTAKRGNLSTISLNLPQGLVVTTNRYDMDRVATEWGVAELKGKDVAARAQALVKIAHPKFRKELAQQGMQRFGGEAKAWQQAAQATKGELRMAKAFAWAEARAAAAK
jgi:4-hydroxybutyrate CoA-transferase